MVTKNDPTLTLAQAAERLGVAHATLTKQARTGRLRAAKVGPIYLVSEAEVERYREWSLGRPGRKSRGEQ
jgi:excisionase family DNA binding protein